MYHERILHWLDDREAEPAGSAMFEKRCPIDDRVLAQVARGDARDVARAVDLASCAADAWGRQPAPRRGDVLGRAAALLRARQDEFTDIIAAETGKPRKFAAGEIGSSADLAVFMEGEG